MCYSTLNDINAWLGNRRSYQLGSHAKFKMIKEGSFVELTPNPLAEKLMKDYHHFMREEFDNDKPGLHYDPRRINIYHKFHKINPGKIASVIFGHLNMDYKDEQPKQYLLGIVQELSLIHI